MHRILLLIFILLLSCDIFTEPEKKAIVRIVPDEYPSIQSALDETLSGDTILVKPGTYYENIQFSSSNTIHLISTDGPDSTTIFGNNVTGLSHTVNINSGNLHMDGFTIKGNGVGAISTYEIVDSITLRNIYITECAGPYRVVSLSFINYLYMNTIHMYNNLNINDVGVITAVSEVGLSVSALKSEIENVYIYDNPFTFASFFVSGSDSQNSLKNIFINNNDSQEGLVFYPGNHMVENVVVKNQYNGIYVYDANLLLKQVVLMDNTHGLIISNSSNAMITNALVVNNATGVQISAWNPTLENVTVYANDNDFNISTSATIINSIIEEYMDESAYIVFSNIENGYAGEDSTNINLEPIFYNLNYPDTSLFSFSTDYTLNVESPCIDSGHPGEAYNDADGTRNDMGAFGGPSGNWLPVNIE